MVEVERNKMSSKSSCAVKQEKRDDQEEIDQLAAKMVEVNRAKMATLNAQAVGPIGMCNPLQAGARAVPGTLLNYFSRNSAGLSAKDVVEAVKEKSKGTASATSAVTESLDQESAKGRFGWTDSPVNIPYIYRRDSKFCSVRIFEQRVVKMYGSILRQELAGCVSIQSSYVSEIEARLLNEINVKHCDGQYGREHFTVRDLVINLVDALELLHFVQTCQEKLVRKSCNPDDRCGFFRIGGESVVPYTVIEGVKYVPLFYFEGETVNLDKKAIQITGWDLAYLKLCCKVQGIRNELFSNDSYSAVSVEEIKQQFPANTDLQLYWPSRSLLDNHSNNASGIGGSISMWIQKPSGNPPPLPVTTPALPNAGVASSVIQKTPSSTIARPQPQQAVSVPSASALLQATNTNAPSRPTPTVPTSSSLYNGWNSMGSYAQQLQQQHRESSNSSSSAGAAQSAAEAAASAHLASMLQSNATARAQAAAVSAMLMQPSLPPMPSHATGMGALNMMHYAQAMLNMQQQAQLPQTHRIRSQPAPPPPPPPPTSSSTSAALDNLLRSNGLLSDHQRPSHGLTSSSLMNRTVYSSSQSPLTGVVPGSSPHSRNSTGASPRPGLPVPASSLSHSLSSSSSSSLSSAPKPPPPPLIPVNGSHGMFSPGSQQPSPSSSSTRLSATETSQHGSSRSYHHSVPPLQQQQQQQQYSHHLQQQQRHLGLQAPPLPLGQPQPQPPPPPPPPQHQTMQMQQQQQSPPFKLQLFQIENQMVPCVNSRQYVYNNLMIALPDMATYLFPHLSHQTCKEVLQDGLGVTLYDANPQQLQVLKSSSKVSSVASISSDKVSLVNVRDVVQYMPQIRYMMSRVDGGAGGDLSHAHSSKRQRVS